MKLILGDAGFWIARRDESDENHRAALRLTQELLQRRASFVITPLIFAEVHAHFSRARIKRERIISDCWNNPVVRLEELTFADQEEAIDILQTNKDKAFSFCDAVSFAVMLRMEIATAVSFDQHFKQFGCFKIIDGSDL